MINNDFSAIAPIEDNVVAQASVGVEDRHLAADSSVGLSCCGLFGASHDNHNQYGEGGISESSDQSLSMFGCCRYEKSDNQAIGQDGANESTSETLMCCGISCGYKSSCDNGIPSCSLSGEDKCEWDAPFVCVAGVVSTGASAACEAVNCVLSVL